MARSNLILAQEQNAVQIIRCWCQSAEKMSDKTCDKTLRACEQLQARASLERLTRNKLHWCGDACHGCNHLIQGEGLGKKSVNTTNLGETRLHLGAHQKEALPVPVADPALPSSAAQQCQQGRAARQAQYETAHALAQAGLTRIQIAQQLGLCRATIGRWLQMSAYPAHPGAKRQGQPLSSILDPFKPYLAERFAAGCQSANHLHREIQQRGFEGGASLVRKYVCVLRYATGNAAALPTTPLRRWTIPDLVFLVVRRATERTTEEQQLVSSIATLHPALAQACALTERFTTLVRTQQSTELDGWLTFATLRSRVLADPNA